METIKKRDRNLVLFLTANALMGVLAAVENTSFSSKLYDLGFDILKRSIVEVPRELPGLFTVLLIALFFRMDSRKIAAISCMAAGVGIILFGFVPSDILLVIVTIIFFSTGQHLYIPVMGTLSMSFAEGNKIGRRLGQVQGLNTLVLIISCVLFYGLYNFFHVPYYVVFTIGGLAAITAGILFLRMKSGQTILQKTRFVFKKQYSLYYLLAIVNGARRQLTFTFVPWVILNVFDKNVVTVTLLFMSVSTINVFFRPFMGRLVDRMGERFVLTVEAMTLFLVCVTLAGVKAVFATEVAFYIACGCYIIDQLLATANIARTTLAYRLVEDKSEVAGTLAMGTSMDHIMAVLMPVIAGYVWYINGATGYIYVFIGGAVISLINLIIATRIKVRVVHEPEMNPVL